MVEPAAKSLVFHQPSHFHKSLECSRVCVYVCMGECIDACVFLAHGKCLAAQMRKKQMQKQKQTNN